MLTQFHASLGHNELTEWDFLIPVLQDVNFIICDINIIFIMITGIIFEYVFYIAAKILLHFKSV